ncbi:hypothetical protein C8N24_6394 [Solirubrobacter pauli]|uniref:Uncharacterized protein n=1 Tax=Solirubrobacter pauli TaxID=166793 RepID=A0A660L6A4_9ACTN|nr:hypothetical protein [Solirubrobacter pauli]RKQ88352.1 hypothetical protein C8N24_6394 [Solirubrobacter pauli]
MRLAAGAPTRWTVLLRDGSKLVVWADGYVLADEHYVFSSLFDFDEEDEMPDDDLVVAVTPSNPRRLMLAIARIPRLAVLLEGGDTDWPAIESR